MSLITLAIIGGLVWWLWGLGMAIAALIVICALLYVGEDLARALGARNIIP